MRRKQKCLCHATNYSSPVWLITIQVSDNCDRTEKIPLATNRHQEMMGWQWHQLDHMQNCKSFAPQISMPAPHHSIFLQAGCSSWRPTNSVKALKTTRLQTIQYNTCTHTHSQPLRSNLRCRYDTNRYEPDHILWHFFTMEIRSHICSCDVPSKLWTQNIEICGHNNSTA